MRKFKGNVTTPKGFAASGVMAGIRKKNKKDIALVYSATPCVAGATFTTNKVKAAPVTWDMEILKNGKGKHAVVLNSGIANACMGKQGVEDNYEMASAAALALSCNPDQVFTASTGVIGQPMPMGVVVPGIEAAAKKLGINESDGQDAAEAIMTTDTVSKTVACQFTAEDDIEVTLGGMSKGSGMIHPNMATMLSVVTTDINIDEALLQEAVSTVVADTFNMISVDRDTSTNDTFIVLANGLAGNEKVTKKNKVYDDFVLALFIVCKDLAMKMAGDGEGATKTLEVKVRHARTHEDAVKIAKAVISSNLVKAAFYGSDANWGRVLCAMGYSGGEFDPDKVDIYLQDGDDRYLLVKNGMAVNYSEEKATELLSKKLMTFRINCNDGYEKATAWGCDLTYDYVKINGDYRS
ncbi:MAG: bifunctional glutamate N-acetyltransferase/amino-acid acetyltransferase ArgJ [Lachnospiraceae bacterium]|nr:bifunctional glutamate N-acetyltransferase/amino-acid acetyltransferase ArgJ [Lachnospiraceae bacterium]